MVKGTLIDKRHLLRKTHSKGEGVPIRKVGIYWKWGDKSNYLGNASNFNSDTSISILTLRNLIQNGSILEVMGACQILRIGQRTLLYILRRLLP